METYIHLVWSMYFLTEFANVRVCYTSTLGDYNVWLTDGAN